MPEMNIVRIEKNRDHPYVIIDKRIMENEALSWEARGLLGYLLSRPDNWEVRMGDLEARSPSGATKTRRIFKELETAGYVVRNIARNKKDRHICWVTRVHECPRSKAAQEASQNE